MFESSSCRRGLPKIQQPVSQGAPLTPNVMVNKNSALNREPHTHKGQRLTGSKEQFIQEYSQMKKLNQTQGPAQNCANAQNSNAPNCTAAHTSQQQKEYYHYENIGYKNYKYCKVSTPRQKERLVKAKAHKPNLSPDIEEVVTNKYFPWLAPGS